LTESPGDLNGKDIIYKLVMGLAESQIKNDETFRQGDQKNQTIINLISTVGYQKTLIYDQ
jgi:hypothetical protein